MKHFWTRFLPVVAVIALIVLALTFLGGNVSVRGGVCPGTPVDERCPGAATVTRGRELHRCDAGSARAPADYLWLFAHPPCDGMRSGFW